MRSSRPSSFRSTSSGSKTVFALGLINGLIGAPGRAAVLAEQASGLDSSRRVKVKVCKAIILGAGHLEAAKKQKIQPTPMPVQHPGRPYSAEIQVGNTWCPLATKTEFYHLWVLKAPREPEGEWSVQVGTCGKREQAKGNNEIVLSTKNGVFYLPKVKWPKKTNLDAGDPRSSAFEFLARIKLLAPTVEESVKIDEPRALETCVLAREIDRVPVGAKCTKVEVRWWRLPQTPIFPQPILSQRVQCHAMQPRRNPKFLQVPCSGAAAAGEETNKIYVRADDWKSRVWLLTKKGGEWFSETMSPLGSKTAVLPNELQVVIEGQKACQIEMNSAINKLLELQDDKTPSQTAQSLLEKYELFSEHEFEGKFFTGLIGLDDLEHLSKKCRKHSSKRPPLTPNSIIIDQNGQTLMRISLSSDKEYASDASEALAETKVPIAELWFHDGKVYRSVPADLLKGAQKESNRTVKENVIAIFKWRKL